MQRFFGALLVLFAMVTMAHATVLPDACGNDNVKFDVKTMKDQPAPAAPGEGKAQIVFIENNNQMVSPFSYATIRYGMDGAWVGANKGDSYFVVNVEPGVHHVCISWQSAIGRVKKSIDVSSFMAEAGKVYYFAAQVNLMSGGSTYIPPSPGPDGTSGGGMTVQNSPNIIFGLVRLNEDEGKYRVKAWKKSSWTSHS